MTAGSGPFAGPGALLAHLLPPQVERQAQRPAAGPDPRPAAKSH